MFYFSTNEITASERFEYWREVVCKHCIPAESKTPHRNLFDAKISGRTVGVLRVATMVSPEHKWIRSQNDLKLSPEAGFWLSYMEDGVGQLEQNGKSVLQNSGDIVLYDAARPFEYNLLPNTGVSSVVHIMRMPRDLLLFRTRQATSIIATPFDSNVGLKTIIIDMIKELQINPLMHDNSLAASHFSDSMLDIIASAIELCLGREVDKKKVDAIYDRACLYIKCNIGDPALSAQSMADALGVSLRTIMRIFARNGTTPARHIWQMRLEGSYCSLAQGTSNRISDVAMNYGFSDFSHFSRSFKKAFGITPRKLLRKR